MIVRPMLDMEGSIETARQCKNTVQAEDKRVDLIVQELDSYDLMVAALQQTKWYESTVYHVGGSVLLTAGCPTPALGERFEQGEGVAIVLSGPAIAAWRVAGERWKAWSSRLVSEFLQTGSKKADHLHVLSCYAPTRVASRAVKDAFLQDPGQALTAIPPDEPYILLGDLMLE